ncbi:MAG: DEAD/DEAH box helicase [Saprospiraceae bacterium]|nr:DEAD/DEAH box helicase [Saprospiraceae bacterium]
MNLFESLGVDPQLAKAAKELGFETPTEIQDKAIPLLLAGTKDFIGLAQTGTGKTAAFGLPLLQLIDSTKKHPQALIICPTRELCMQISKDLVSYKKHKTGINTCAVYGGASIVDQLKEIKRGVQVVVATPGRLIDVIERKAIDLSHIRYVVLDEADEMLNMGFREDIEYVLQHTPERQSIWLFSATMPVEVKEVSKRFMNKPFEITIGKLNTANASIDHQYFMVLHSNRYEALKRLIDFNPGIYGIIFTRTKLDAQNISEMLVREGYDVEALHGDLTQAQRDKVMTRFRAKQLQLIIATDVAARGIDVKGMSHVINYELPDDPEIYTHRSGRTGRAGLSGICMSIVTPREKVRIDQIERFVKTPFHKLDIPSGTEVCRKQFFHFIDKMFAADVTHSDYDTYLPALKERFANVDKEEILKRMAALEFNRFLQYYENAADLNMKREDRSVRGKERSRKESDGGKRNGDFGRTGIKYKKLFVNLGQKDGFYKASFLQFILDSSNLKKETLGRIDMKNLSSIIEIEGPSANKMIKALDGKMYKGRKIKMNED